MALWNYIKGSDMKKLILISLIFMACTGPSIQKNEPYPCYMERYCRWAHKKEPTACTLKAKACYDYLTKNRNYIFCREQKNRWKDQTEQNCWNTNRWYFSLKYTLQSFSTVRNGRVFFALHIRAILDYFLKKHV
jgi:hypothetical protein